MNKFFYALAISVVTLAEQVFAATVSEAGFGFQTRVGINTTAEEAGDPSGVLVEILDISETTVESSVSGSNGRIGEFSGTNKATVSGDIRTGKIGLVADSKIRQEASAEINLFDTLFFDLTDLASSEAIDIKFFAFVEGTMSRGSQPNFFLRARNGDQDFLALNYGFRTTSDVPIMAADAESNTIFTQIGDFEVIGPTEFSGLLTLVGGQVNEVEIRVGLSGDTNVDFSNTASILLFSDRDFTSASGEFLSEIDSAKPTPVPVPASALMMLCASLCTFGIKGLYRLRFT
ncbi:hypothetical protein [uncultured Roseobacter sp.]|uniref:hypothetical protein n=1 Tax=uncultured Roseobacter sp. TaxID=114847 RepID=UPI00260A8B28|nr:hypothetical protein [uncultured Roseobacter sp.]